MLSVEKQALEARVDRRIQMIKKILDTQFYNKCRNVLQQMKELDKGNIFLRDPSTLENYHKLVRTPMCWSFIEEKLENYSYPTTEHFVNDMRLVLDNCYAYNQPTSEVATIGRRLEIHMEELFMRELGIAPPNNSDIKEIFHQRDYKAAQPNILNILRLYEHYSGGKVDLQLCTNATRRRIYKIALETPMKAAGAATTKAPSRPAPPPKPSSLPVKNVAPPPTIELEKVPQNSRNMDVMAGEENSPLHISEEDFDEDD